MQVLQLPLAVLPDAAPEVVQKRPASGDPPSHPGTKPDASPAHKPAAAHPGPPPPDTHPPREASIAVSHPHPSRVTSSGGSSATTTTTAADSHQHAVPATAAVPQVVGAAPAAAPAGQVSVIDATAPHSHPHPVPDAASHVPATDPVRRAPPEVVVHAHVSPVHPTAVQVSRVPAAHHPAGGVAAGTSKGPPSAANATPPPPPAPVVVHAEIVAVRRNPVSHVGGTSHSEIAPGVHATQVSITAAAVTPPAAESTVPAGANASAAAVYPPPASVVRVRSAHSWGRHHAPGVHVPPPAATAPDSPSRAPAAAAAVVAGTAAAADEIVRQSAGGEHGRRRRLLLLLLGFLLLGVHPSCHRVAVARGASGRLQDSRVARVEAVAAALLIIQTRAATSRRDVGS